MVRLLVAVAGALSAMLWAQPVSATFGVIPDRPELDGAGPTNIFRLPGRHVAVVDPLLEAVHAYRISGPGDAAGASAKVAGSCRLPHDFRAWRIVRRGSIVTVVDEQERWSLDVPLRLSVFRQRDCRIARRPYRAATDAGPRFARISAGEIRIQNGRATIRIEHPHGEIFSIQELEREGRVRTFLVKRSAVDMPALGHSASIGVDVVAMRFDDRGRLLAERQLPDQTGWVKRAFDYATVLPGGQLMYLHHRQNEDFRFTIEPLEGTRPVLARGERHSRPRTQEPLGISLAVRNLTGKASAMLSSVGARIARSTGRWPEPRTQAPDGKEIVRTAESFLRVEPAWSMPPVRLPEASRIRPGEHWVCIEGKRQRWVQPLLLRQPSDAGYTAVPYSYGGRDDPGSFIERARSEPLIGHIGDSPEDDAGSCQPGDVEVQWPLPGVDCSKLVWHAWGRPAMPSSLMGRVLDTRSTFHMMRDQSFPGMCRKMVASHKDLQPGDVIVRPGHVAIFSRFVTAADGVSRLAEVIEAASRCSTVCRSRYELDYMHGWRIYRREGRSDGVPCPE